MPAKRVWTEAESIELRRMIDNRASTAAMAARFGVGPQHMRRMIHALGYRAVGKNVDPHWQMPAPKAEPTAVDPDNREQNWWPLPSGHPETWGPIVRGTILEGQDYPR